MFGKKSDHYYQGAVPQSATNPRTEFKIFQISVGYDFLVDLGVRTFRLQHSMCVYVGVGFLGVLSGVCSMCTVRAPSTCSFPIFKNEKKNENVFITYFSCHLDLTRYFN